MEDKLIEIIEKVSGTDIIKKDKTIDLIDSGILDSLAFIELIAMLQEKFNIQIYPTQVDPNVWRSFDLIKKLVENSLMANIN